MANAATRPAYLVRGDDASLVAQGVHDLLTMLVGKAEPAMVVEEHGPGSEDLDVGVVVDALTTPPFLTDRRIVVVRDAGRLAAADAPRLAACLDHPVPGVHLVLAVGGGTVPAAVVKAVERVGEVRDTKVGTGRARTQWLSDHLHHAPVRLDARARDDLSEHLGEDVSRLRGLLDTLAAAYGQGAAIDCDRLAPFLGEAGGVPSWDLTDAIDGGRTDDALRTLGRMFGAGGLHPLQVMATLHRHFQSMLRLDGAGVTAPEEAASYLGMRSTYPAKKALEQSRRLGPAGISRAVTLLADADLDIRGRSALASETVLEVLVGRLSRLSGVARSAGGQSRRARGSSAGARLDSGGASTGAPRGAD